MYTNNSTLLVTAITVVSYPLTLLWIILYVCDHFTGAGKGCRSYRE